MIAYAQIGEWTIGPAGNVRCDMTVEPIRADARNGSEADGLAISFLNAMQYFDPPPLGQTVVLVDTAGASVAEGVIDAVNIVFGGDVRIRIDL